jgi:LysR family glycine cleavage system transcriptional activator
MPATLPPLEGLRVFESAGRNGTFTAAAGELGLTQAAVSQRIRNLEGRLGVRLFDRQARGVELTAEGEAYLPHVHDALNALLRSTADLFGTPRRKVAIAAPASVAQIWLAPRLANLTLELPDLQISLASVQRPADYSAAAADYEIRFGSGDWPGRQARRLYHEILAPAAAPPLLASRNSDWRRLPQIAIIGPRDGWREWADAAGVAPPRPPSMRFDSFAPALGAAVRGAGILLASLGLSRQELEAGRLERLPEPSVRMDRCYWLTWSGSTVQFSDHETIVALLCEQHPPNPLMYEQKSLTGE